MATSWTSLCCCAVFVTLLFTTALACSGVSSSNFYTTKDSKLAANTAVIVEFSLDQSCSKGMNVYAEFNGRTAAAVRSPDGSKYEVSWTDEHKNIQAGSYNVRFFDEEGYAALRKAQRSGEETSNVKSLFTVPIKHAGASHSGYLQSEFVAACVAILVWYMAQTTRNRLQA